MRTQTVAYLLFVNVAYCFGDGKTGMIDSTTPSSVYNITSTGITESYDLVFSDEFNTAGRSFGEGSDERWTSINSYNFNTGDFEAYVPDAITTKDGNLVITTSPDITLDPSGSPRAFTSGMLQSWNKTCFTGGVLEMSFDLPGKVDTTSQLWAAAWMSGMLGRPAFGPLQGISSNADLWPYSYNLCDNIAEKNMKYSACTTVSEYCTARNLTSSDCAIIEKNKALLGENGRGMTELDVFELFTSISYQYVTDSKAALSTSYQVAPNTDGEAWSKYTTGSTCYNTVYQNCATAPLNYSSTTYCTLGLTGAKYPCSYPHSVGNNYHGEAGRDSISALTPLSEDDFEKKITMRLEWEPKKWMRWLIKRESDTVFSQMLEIKQEALAACGTTGQRDIPEEPQYMLFNTAMADQAGWVNTTQTALWEDAPYEFKVDYVRYYQRASASSIGCSPTGYPTSDYIKNNPTIFANPDATLTSVACTDTCGNGTTSANWTAGVYSFHDTRCPSFGSMYTTGCTPPYENLCRACFTKTAFVAAAFTSEGVYGEDKYIIPSSKPICPPCVCQKWGLSASECAEQTLPGSTGTCTELAILHPSGKMLAVNYCSNGNKTTSETLTQNLPRSVEEAVKNMGQKSQRPSKKRPQADWKPPVTGSA